MRKTVLIIILLCSMGLWINENIEKETVRQRVERIYKDVARQTGLRNLVPPIRVEKNPTINAYTDGKEIVIYTGIIEACENDDELALVIGHEIAHNTLFHLSFENTSVDVQNILESNADKMGELYALKAGYDVCRGREFWKRMKDIDGDYLGANHPDMAYRYSELNIQCENK